MKKEGFYSSGEFAKLAHVTKKTLRYYNDHKFLVPSYVNENGARFYTDQDFERLQQILLLKYLNFSLDDIREMTLTDSSEHSLSASLDMQLRLLEDRMEQMQTVREILLDTRTAVEKEEKVDWSRLMGLIHETGMENSLKAQYRNVSNIEARIDLHRLCSFNKKGWFPWLYDVADIQDKQTVLEVGCGNGRFWIENYERIPQDVHILLTDSSEGILRDLQKEQLSGDDRFSMEVMDFHELRMEDDSVDMVVANHVLFYAKDMDCVLREVRRVLKPGGKFVCSTYGANHMKEISELVKEFDDRIVLAAEQLFEIFGKDNGKELLRKYFDDVQWVEYEDYLTVTNADLLIAYILSCHGNQNRYIVDHYKEFRSFVRNKVENGLRITKEAGVFLGM